MGFFGKKKVNEEDAKYHEEKTVLKTELELAVESLQTKSREKQVELDDITQKITAVKEEYSSTVTSLMSVKKELNQKNMDLDIAKREYKESVERNKKLELIQDTQSIDKFKKTQGEYTKIKNELVEFTKKYDKLQEQIAQEQTVLHNIQKQRIDVKKELEEANSRLYNAKTELDKKDTFEDTNILTSSEKEFIEVNKNNENNSAGIIEAASVVVGSLKLKLNNAQKELEAVQASLEKERIEHENTRTELEKLKRDTTAL